MRRCRVTRMLALATCQLCGCVGLVRYTSNDGVAALQQCLENGEVLGSKGIILVASEPAGKNSVLNYLAYNLWASEESGSGGAEPIPLCSISYPLSTRLSKYMLHRRKDRPEVTCFCGVADVGSYTVVRLASTNVDYGDPYHEIAYPTTGLSLPFDLRVSVAPGTVTVVTLRATKKQTPSSVTREGGLSTTRYAVELVSDYEPTRAKKGLDVLGSVCREFKPVYEELRELDTTDVKTMFDFRKRHRHRLYLICEDSHKQRRWTSILGPSGVPRNPYRRRLGLTLATCAAIWPTGSLPGPEELIVPTPPDRAAPE